VIQRRFDPERLLHLVERERITTLMAVPTHYDLIMQAGAADGRHDLSSLRYAVATAAPVRRDTIDWMAAHICPRVSNIYGLTEATTLITICPPEEMARFTDEPCIGRSLVGMEVRLVSPEEPMPSPDAVVPTGELGQLICRGPKLMREYYRNPEKTAERLKDGWLYTGDICRADVDGYYYISDRLDDLIITGGENVYPTEIEHVLNEHPEVLESVVLGAPDPTWGQRIKAYVVPRGPGLTAEVVDQWVRTGGRLAGYKRPQEIEIVAEIPRNPSGKVLKKVLRQP
jgi:fatty-acyl-CoA synthase